MFIKPKPLFLLVFFSFSAHVHAQITMDTIPGKRANEKAARVLSNPNNPYATVHCKFQSYLYDGVLPQSSQGATAFTLQPSFPFRLKNGHRIFVRPAVPFWFHKPVINHAGNIEKKSGLGDIQWDMLYGMEYNQDWRLGLGLLNTFPTAADNLGGYALISGPNIIIIKQYNKTTLSLDVRHQESIGSKAAYKSKVSTVKPIVTILPGNGWSVGSGPQMDFNHLTGEWTVPLNINFSKTNQTRRNQVWKIYAEINYYVLRPEYFSPKWYFLVDISPLVRNFFVR